MTDKNLRDEIADALIDGLADALGIDAKSKHTLKMGLEDAAWLTRKVLVSMCFLTCIAHKRKEDFDEVCNEVKRQLFETYPMEDRDLLWKDPDEFYSKLTLWCRDEAEIYLGVRKRK